jgi:hypothetical protein
METVLFYTFSTIPQTVATALGVLAVFVLYRLQADSETRWHDSRTLLEQFVGVDGTCVTQPGATLSDLLGRQEYKRFVTELGDHYAAGAGNPPPGSVRHLAWGRLKASIAARDQIIAALNKAFLFTSITILYSLGMLIVAQTAGAFPLGALLSLLLGIGCVAYCLSLYWIVIRAALEVRSLSSLSEYMRLKQ